MRRLPLTPAQVDAVAQGTPCAPATVRRWLHGYDGHRCQDAAIVAALARLDLHPTRLDPMARVDRETRQLVMTAVDTPPAESPAHTIAAWQDWYKRAVGDRFDHVENIAVALGREPEPLDTPPDNPPVSPRGESGNGGQFGAGHQPHKRLVGESPNMGQPGDARSCPVGLDDSMSPTPTAPVGRSATIQRCHVTVIGPDGKAIVDEVTL